MVKPSTATHIFCCKKGFNISCYLGPISLVLTQDVKKWIQLNTSCLLHPSDSFFDGCFLRDRDKQAKKDVTIDLSVIVAFDVAVYDSSC